MLELRNLGYAMVSNSLDCKIRNISISSGNINGAEPKSMICKISGNTKRDIKLIWRLIFHHQMKGHVDEFMSRIESSFYKEIIPRMHDTGYCSPKMYFNGKHNFTSSHRRSGKPNH